MTPDQTSPYPIWLVVIVMIEVCAIIVFGAFFMIVIAALARPGPSAWDWVRLGLLTTVAPLFIIGTLVEGGRRILRRGWRIPGIVLTLLPLFGMAATLALQVFA